MIPIAKPIIGRAERKNVLKVMKTGNLAQGPQVSAFENEFSKIVGSLECVAVNSGTSALHVSLLSLGISAGDEVLVPSFTFAATANAVALTGATPVFIDIDSTTFNIDPSKLEKNINKKTKAIIAVHLFGLPASMIQIAELAKKHGLFLIEDAAQAHLAEINGKPAGTFGDAAIFSFYPTKNMTTSEGGMCVFKDAQNARYARLLRNQGMETRYQNEIIGFNLRMTEIEAAIGLAQIKRLPKWTEIRRKNAEFLLSEISHKGLPTAPSGYKHVYHQFTIRANKNRDKIVGKLNEMGVGTSVFYPTQVHKLPSFNLEIDLPETRKATEQVFSIPVHPSLSKKDLRKIASSVNKVLDQNV